jgi:uncharacterized membrane protein YeaQ/YmgE (transglycosylase-associated protein family)
LLACLAGWHGALEARFSNRSRNAARGVAGTVVRGSGFSLIRDAAIGIVGSFVGEWFMRRCGVDIASGIVGLIINAALGAIVVLVILCALGATVGAGDASRPTQGRSSPDARRATARVVRSLAARTQTTGIICWSRR